MLTQNAKSIVKSYKEKHYTLELIDGKIALVQKESVKCFRNNHSKNLKDFFNNFYLQYPDDDDPLADIKDFYGWAENLGKTSDELMNYVKELHAKKLEEQPERFI